MHTDDIPRSMSPKVQVSAFVNVYVISDYSSGSAFQSATCKEHVILHPSSTKRARYCEAPPLDA